MTEDLTDELNPYRSPETPVGVISACEVPGDPTAPLEITLIRSRPLYRHIKLTGRFNADVCWNAMGWQEFVSVNGQKAAAEYATWSIPCFTIEMHSNGTMHTVTVETCVTWIYFTRAFRFSIDGQSFYSEGDCSRLVNRPTPHAR